MTRWVPDRGEWLWAVRFLFMLVMASVAGLVLGLLIFLGIFAVGTWPR